MCQIDQGQEKFVFCIIKNSKTLKNNLLINVGQLRVSKLEIEGWPKPLRYSHDIN